MTKYQEILAKYWSYPSFRPLQEDIIRSVDAEKKDALGLLPTGGGKSIIFQVPALASEGICLVVTPLIALMKDQVANLKKRNIRAAAIYSGMSRREMEMVLDNCSYGGYKFLYLSPERLATQFFLDRLNHLNINLLAIDEAHCISQWGYDFRPSYLRIADIRERLPDVPVLALTATATPQVAKDIQARLLFKKENLFVKSFARENLVYIVRQVEDKNDHLLKVAHGLTGSGVVYVRSRKRTAEYAEFLMKNGITADYYHAGLSNEWKDYKQQHWREGKIRIMVATNAFGMGIDKADVRFVVHMDVPDSLEAYYQEAGRGGRDEKQAFAVLLYNQEDRRKLERQLHDSFPERDEVRRVYDALGNFLQVGIGTGQYVPFDFVIGDFARQYKFSIRKILAALKLLQSEGYLEFTEEVNAPSKLFFKARRDDLYKLQVKSSDFDRFVKAILRSYTGLFSDYVAIDENFLAKKLSTSREKVIDFLKKLRHSKVIDYIPQKRHPVLTFTANRVNAKQIRLSKENYEEKQKRMQARIEAVLHYTENTETCRSQMLLAYFGETESQACGHCDYCRATKKNNKDEEKQASVTESLLHILQGESLELKQISYKLQYSEDRILAALRVLIDENKVVRKADGTFGMLSH